jgi:hypothetical protein
MVIEDEVSRNEGIVVPKEKRQHVRVIAAQ